MDISPTAQYDNTDFAFYRKLKMTNVGEFLLRLATHLVATLNKEFFKKNANFHTRWGLDNRLL